MDTAQLGLAIRRLPLLASVLALSDDQQQLLYLGFVLIGIITILVAANLGERHETWRIAAYLLMIGVAIIVALLGLLNLAVIVVSPDTAASAAKSAGVSVGRLAAGASLELGAALAAGLALVPAVRRGLGRLVPAFRPDSAINAVGLSLYMLVLLFYVSIQLSSDQLKQLSRPGPSPSVLFIIASNQLPFLIVALAGVGLFTRRSLRQSILRLGLYWPGWRWVIGAIGVAVALVIFGTFFDSLMNHLTPEQSKNIQKASDQLLKNVNSLGPAIAIALAAGIGEEVLFRGALQPRLGIVAAALLFAVLHAQYAVSLATMEIFLLGIFLGLLRRRAGTTAAIIAHTGYDMILLLMALYLK
jgi:membrane protease YdiL (CAAX protease family)